MSLPALPPLKPAELRWHASPEDSRTVQRFAFGTEAWVGVRDENAKGQYDNYLNTTLRVPASDASSSLSLEHLREGLAAALVHVRFQHPEVACTALWKGGDVPPPPLILYTPPKDNAEALEWARGVVESRITPKTGLGVRTEIEAQRRMASTPAAAKSVTIYVVADVADEKVAFVPGAKVDLLMHFNHIYWDGTSARRFAGDLLRRFGQQQSSTRVQQLLEYSWGEEIANLSKPLLDACKVDINAVVEELNNAWVETMTGLSKIGSSWGVPVQNTVGTPRTEWHTFSKAESEAMIRTGKARLGPQFTLTHLGHAAMVLALLKARPLPPDAPNSTVLVTPLPVDGRRFLRDEYANKQYGICVTNAMVEFANLRSWAATDDSNVEAVKTALEKGCKHVKRSYDYWLAMECSVPLALSLSNFIADNVASSPAPFTGSSAPVFVSDGIVDRYVPADVVNASGDKLMTVDNCVFFIDTYRPDVQVRMDSFKGATTLALCFNDGYYSSEDGARFLKYVAEFMLMFAV